MSPAAPAEPLIEALVIDRERLIRLFRITLAELHDRRHGAPHFSAEGDIAEMLRYWETVFGWIKEQRGEEVVVMTRRP